MIKLSTLKNLLNVEDDEIEKLGTEQLRVLLGVFRFFIRRLQREVNQRISDETLVTTD